MKILQLVVAFLYFGSLSLWAAKKNWSLEEVMSIALRENFEILDQQLNLEKSDNSLKIAKATFHPTPSLSYTRGGSGHKTTLDEKASSAYVEESNSDTDTFSFSLTQKTWLGPSFTLGVDSIKSTSETVLSDNTPASVRDVTTTKSDAYTSSLSASLDFPLLKGGWLAANYNSVRMAENNIDSANYELQQTRANQMALIVQLYLDLYKAYKNSEIKKRALESAKTTYEYTKARIEVGKLPRIEMYSAEVGLKGIEAELLTSEKSIADLNGKLLIELNLFPNIEIVPVELPVFSEIEMDFKKYWKILEIQAPRMKTLSLALRNSQLSLDTAENTRLPQLDLTASYKFAGSGSDNHKNTLDQAMDATNTRTWSVGLSLSVPLFNDSAYYSMVNARKDEIIAQHTKQKGILSFKEELKDAFRSLELEKKQWEIAKISFESKKKELEAADIQYKTGKISADKLFEFQSEFFAKELGIQESRISYYKAIITLRKLAGNWDYFSKIK